MPERGFRRVRLIAALTLAGVTGLAGGTLPTVVLGDDGRRDAVPGRSEGRRADRNGRRRRRVPDDRHDRHDGHDAASDLDRRGAADDDHGRAGAAAAPAPDDHGCGAPGADDDLRDRGAPGARERSHARQAEGLRSGDHAGVRPRASLAPHDRDQAGVR